MAGGSEQTVVCIVARAYAEMAEQLIRLGYGGKIYKLADYNSYAEYSLSEQIIARRRKRVEEGIHVLFPHWGMFILQCPICLVL